MIAVAEAFINTNLRELLQLKENLKKVLSNCCTLHILDEVKD